MVMKTNVCSENSDVRNVDAVGWVETRGRITPRNVKHVTLTSCPILWRHWKVIHRTVTIDNRIQLTCVENAKLSDTVADKLKTSWFNSKSSINSCFVFPICNLLSQFNMPTSSFCLFFKIRVAKLLLNEIIKLLVGFNPPQKSLRILITNQYFFRK